MVMQEPRANKPINVAIQAALDAIRKLLLNHSGRHENGGADEIAVTGLSGLLADDQHVLDAEVVAVAIAKTTVNAQSVLGGVADDTPVAIAVGEQTLVGRITGGDVTALSLTQLAQLLKGSGFHHSKACTYISGTGTAGADNTAQTVKTVTLPANSLTQVGDRIRIRTYWMGNTGSAVTCTQTLNGVTIAHTTDLGATSLFLDESWLHYIDNTHANIIETEAGALGAVSAPNVAGFDWDSDQAINADQDLVINNHIIVFAIIADVLPKGLI
jgi:hypothetical protein